MKALRILSQPTQTSILFRQPQTTPFLGRLLSETKRCYSSSGATMAAQKPAQEYRQVYVYIDGVENIDRYDKGGYHPITIGDILNKRYTIVGKLGHGGYSTVWVARDMQQEEYIALKIGVAKSRMHEISIMKSLSDLRSSLPANPVSLSGFHAIPRLLDDFTIHGPNGEHPSYTTDLAGFNLDKSLNSGMFRIDVARALAVKLVSAIAYMHGRGYVMEIYISAM
ncbi:Serine/threonine-protein kinase spk-1 [Beauveria bassiana]|nr:Serine/threonine-protein kinase spk-1 [Beauveria bassiana]